MSVSRSLGLWHVTFNKEVICLSVSPLVYLCPPIILQAWEDRLGNISQLETPEIFCIQNVEGILNVSLPPLVSNSLSSGYLLGGKVDENIEW